MFQRDDNTFMGAYIDQRSGAANYYWCSDEPYSVITFPNKRHTLAAPSELVALLPGSKTEGQFIGRDGRFRTKVQVSQTEVWSKGISGNASSVRVRPNGNGSMRIVKDLVPVHEFSYYGATDWDLYKDTRGARSMDVRFDGKNFHAADSIDSASLQADMEFVRLTLHEDFILSDQHWSIASAEGFKALHFLLTEKGRAFTYIYRDSEAYVLDDEFTLYESVAEDPLELLDEVWAPPTYQPLEDHEWLLSQLGYEIDNS